MSEQAMDLVCLLPASLCPPSQPGPTLQPPGHRHLRDSVESLCLPLHTPKRGTEVVAWQQISQALKLHRHLQGIVPTWKLDDPRPSAFMIMAKLEELERATRPMCRWGPLRPRRKVTQQVAAHLSLYCSLNPSSSNSLHLSQQSFHVQGLSHLVCFANLESTLHSLRCLKNPHSKVSANTVERNRVEKGQHGDLGSCLAKPSFPRETFEGGGSDLGSGFHCAAEGRTLTERTKKRRLKKAC